MIQGQEAVQGHVVFSGDEERTVSGFDLISACAFGFLFARRYLQGLPDAQGGSVQSVLGHDLFGGDGKFSGDDPQIVPSADFVVNGLTGGDCAGRGSGGSVASWVVARGDLEHFSCNDPVFYNFIAASYLPDRCFVFPCNGGKGVPPADTMVDEHAGGGA